jgi:acyl carrier protein
MSGESVREAICGFLDRPPSAVTDEVSLMELVTDSFSLVELVIFLEQRTGRSATADELHEVVTVGDLIGLLSEASAAFKPPRDRPL